MKVNFNKQRTLSELLTKCGNPRYKPQIWQAIGALTAVDDEEARLYATKTVEDSPIIKVIEPSLLAVSFGLFQLSPYQIDVQHQREMSGLGKLKPSNDFTRTSGDHESPP